MCYTHFVIIAFLKNVHYLKGNKINFYFEGEALILYLRRFQRSKLSLCLVIRICHSEHTLIWSKTIFEFIISSYQCISVHFWNYYVDLVHKENSHTYPILPLDHAEEHPLKKQETEHKNIRILL